MKSQWEVKLKFATQIGNGLRTRLILFLSKIDGPTLCQMLGTMLIQQVLQDSTMNRRSDYVTRACLTLIAPQNF